MTEEELAASSLLPDESLLALLKSGEADMSVATEEATEGGAGGDTAGGEGGAAGAHVSPGGLSGLTSDICQQEEWIIEEVETCQFHQTWSLLSGNSST